MLFVYFPIILISILGYGFFVSNKIIKFKISNLGYQGIVGIFSLLLISYISTQFIPHGRTFNFLVLLIGLFLFLTNLKKMNTNKKNFKLLFFILSLSLIFILIGKNHDDFFYYHFPYILTLTEYAHPLGMGNMNHGFKTHSSIFLLSSLFHLPGVKYNLFHLGPVYILIFSNYIILKLIFNKEIKKKYNFIIYLSLSSLVFINIFFYRLGEHGTDRSAMILIILLVINLLYFINKKKIDDNFLKIFTIIFTIIVSLKAFYLIYLILFIPVAMHVFNSTKSLRLFFNINLLLCLLLFGFVILTNFFNTGCLLFPEKRTCFFDVSWSLSVETVEYLRIHYENWAKAGSGAGYSLADEEKLNYIADLNWVNNWLDKYFFNKVSDLIYSLCFIALIFVILFKGSRSLKQDNRKYKIIFYSLVLIFAMWFMLHPSLRYGGYHLFFLSFFIPISLFLEKFNKSLKNLDGKIIMIVMITALLFTGRNVSRLIKEYKIYSYKPFIDVNYPLNKDGFRYKVRMEKAVKENKYIELYKNRYIFYK
tara:strand:- start:2238 stop:3842 length:1605 start_codon:yes stop_codon:yes gene_type:complete